MLVKAPAKGEEKKCPYCGAARPYGHGSCKPRKVLHAWSHGKRIYLNLHRRRFKCRECKHTFTEGRGLVRSHSMLSIQAETEALEQLKDGNLNQVAKELGISYGTLRRLLERKIDEGTLDFTSDGGKVHPGIDKHSSRHKKPVHTVTEVKQWKMLGILGYDRIATLKRFLRKIRER